MAPVLADYQAQLDAIVLDPKTTHADIDDFVKDNPGVSSLKAQVSAVQTMQLCDDEMKQWLEKLMGLCVDDNCEAAISTVVKEFNSQYQGGLSTYLARKQSRGKEEIFDAYKKDYLKRYPRLDERFQAHFDLVVGARKDWRTHEDSGEWGRILREYNGKVVADNLACFEQLGFSQAEIREWRDRLNQALPNSK